mmetsp:Transcript_6610/g.8664  ORF Transcript_6610/g.8664 Transcript_6610/m.8664 type:complete len:94 (-) Transcript_6610:477-758(-)
MTVVLIPFLVLTDHDTSSPNIGSFAYLFIFLALPFSMKWSLIYPNLIAVWRVEKIIASKQSRQVNVLASIQIQVYVAKDQRGCIQCYLIYRYM